MISQASTSIKAATMLASSALLFLTGCNWDSHADTAAPYLHRVATGQVTLQSEYQVDREFAGEVQAGQSSRLGFEFPGQVAEVFVDVGDTVTAGQELARMDTRLLDSERDELQARRAELEAELDTAERNFQRVRSLQAERLASERELDELRGRTRVLQASLQRVDAALQANKVRLEKSVLRAPFPAEVAERMVDSGVVVAAGTPVVALVQDEVREVHAGVPADLAEALQSGETVVVRAQGRSITGTVIGRGPVVDAATRSRTVRLAVAEDWSPGTLAYAAIPVPISTAGAWLPDTAVTEGARGTWVVYVAVDQGDLEAVLETRSVVVHHANRGELFVSGALQDGDLVVTAGLHRLAPGQRVLTGEPLRIAATD
jgi:RND family efflux transporter MFP subunit